MQYFEKEFSALSNSSKEPQAIQKLRQKAFNRFREIGLPKKPGRRGVLLTLIT